MLFQVNNLGRRDTRCSVSELAPESCMNEVCSAKAGTFIGDALCGEETRVTWILGTLSLSSRVRPNDSTHSGHVEGIFLPQPMESERYVVQRGYQIASR